MNIQRQGFQDLKTWLLRKNRKPLIIRGARQVGKSTLVKFFATEMKLKLLEFNFEIAQMKTLKGDILDPEKMFLEIEAKFDQKLNSETLLFFDEIQKQPSLIPALRYFFEKKHEVPVIAAGSLLEFVLEDHDFEMPVGRIEYYHMGPLTFSEFLNANKKKLLWEQIKMSSDKKQSLTEAQHHQISEQFRDYLYVGGMPEAVKVFIETKDPKEVQRVHASILETYQDDFPKYTTKASLNYLNTVFEKLPQYMGKKVKYSELASELSSREVKKAIELLRLARIIYCCYHTNASGLPLSAQKDERIFKMYFLDVGLLNYLMGITWTQIQDYQDEALLTKGLIAEQFIAQHLAYLGDGVKPPRLYYWLREKMKNNAELDFVTDFNGTIMPIEVKSGESGTLKSLVQFVYEKQSNQAIRFDLKYRSKLEENVKYNVKTGEGESTLVEFKLINLHLGLIELLVVLGH